MADSCHELMASEHHQTHRVQKIFSSGNFFVDIKLALGNNPALFCWVMAS